jgi:predicted nucleic acid-binding protein
MKQVVADSSTLLTLLDTDNFKLLFKLFDQIIITNEVYKEITHKSQHKLTINACIKNGQILCKSITYDNFYQILIKRLDRGESESIVLAKEIKLPLVIDEKKGRSVAKSLGIGIVGLIGIILKLIDSKKITKSRAIEIINEVEANKFRLSDDLKTLVYEFDDSKQNK